MSNEKYDSTRETEIHREQVKEFMLALADDITKRADEHDKSKLEEPEKSVFDAVTHRLKDLKYGSIEYKESLAEMGPGLDHHYEHNRHHPEHFKGIANEKTGLCYRAGVRGMTLVDVIEMFCDWAAATSRHDNGNIVSSIMANMHRFRLGEVLSTVLMNTAREYSMGRNSSMARSGWIGAHPEYRNWVEEVSEKRDEPDFDEKLCLGYYPFDGDFGEVEDRVLKDRIVRVRKSRVCHMCRGPIKVGTRARTLAAVFSGELCNYTWCEDCCRSMASSWNDSGRRLEYRWELGRRRSEEVGLLAEQKPQPQEEE